MIAHELKIGQKIWDNLDHRWGTILLIDHKDEDAFVTDKDRWHIVTYRPEDSEGECEMFVNDCYPIVEDMYFWGDEVCLEIHKDFFDEEHDYDYYCPDRDENCWSVGMFGTI